MRKRREEARRAKESVAVPAEEEKAEEAEEAGRLERFGWFEWVTKWIHRGEGFFFGKGFLMSS